MAFCTAWNVHFRCRALVPLISITKSFKMKEKQFLKFTFSLIVNKLFGGHMGLPAAVIGLFFCSLYTYASQYDTEVFTLPFVIISIYLYLCAIAKSTRKI